MYTLYNVEIYFDTEICTFVFNNYSDDRKEALHVVIKNIDYPGIHIYISKDNKQDVVKTVLIHKYDNENEYFIDARSIIIEDKYKTLIKSCIRNLDLSDPRFIKYCLQCKDLRTALSYQKYFSLKELL